MTLRSFAAVLLLAGGLQAESQYFLRPVAGGAIFPTPVAGVNAAINPSRIVAGANGSLYFVSNNCVFKLDTQGTITRVAKFATRPLLG